ncbi:MAG: hypothetical protein HQL25_00405 [Candidatus Omnitrophica bacterium]|nr:hypothetical protein [Candidatus Omnitrophota bacterium]
MLKRLICFIILFNFIFTNLFVGTGYAQLTLPPVGTMLAPLSAFEPVLIKGLQVHPENPLLFDFIVNAGQTGMKINSPEFKAESQKLVKYFLAAMTIKEKDLWVNLSPNEPDRIIENELGKTQMGQDMLAQDYILKQLTASMLSPEGEYGKKFWEGVYGEIYKRGKGSLDPLSSLWGEGQGEGILNKIWIVADKAKVYEKDNAGYVVGAHLKVLTEKEYKVSEKKQNSGTPLQPLGRGQGEGISSKILKEIIVPAIEKEVNEGAHFAQLRQMFYSMILATWYKQAIKNALLNQVYSDKSKTSGVLSDDPAAKEKIYQQYLASFKKGAYEYIKEEYDPTQQKITARKYFSGGEDLAMLSKVIDRTRAVTPAEKAMIDEDNARVQVRVDKAPLNERFIVNRRDFAMKSDSTMASSTELLRIRDNIDSDTVKDSNDSKVKDIRFMRKIIFRSKGRLYKLVVVKDGEDGESGFAVTLWRNNTFLFGIPTNSTSVLNEKITDILDEMIAIATMRERFDQGSILKNAQGWFATHQILVNTKLYTLELSQISSGRENISYTVKNEKNYIRIELFGAAFDSVESLLIKLSSFLVGWRFLERFDFHEYMANASAVSIGNEASDTEEEIDIEGEKEHVILQLIDINPVWERDRNVVNWRKLFKMAKQYSGDEQIFYNFAQSFVEYVRESGLSPQSVKIEMDSLKTASQRRKYINRINQYEYRFDPGYPNDPNDPDDKAMIVDDVLYLAQHWLKRNLILVEGKSYRLELNVISSGQESIKYVGSNIKIELLEEAFISGPKLFRTLNELLPDWDESSKFNFLGAIGVSPQELVINENSREARGFSLEDLSASIADAIDQITDENFLWAMGGPASSFEWELLSRIVLENHATVTSQAFYAAFAEYILESDLDPADALNEIKALKTRREKVDYIKRVLKCLDEDDGTNRFDPAMVGDVTNGGIDLTGKDMQREIIKENRGVEFKFNPAMLVQFEQGSFTGVVPIILSITPIKIKI